MRQVWFLISAIFFPLGALVRVLEPVLAWLCRFDELNNPDLLPDLRDRPAKAVRSGRDRQYWLNIIIACRTVELLGAPQHAASALALATACRALMVQPDARYARLRAGFATIERDARRRAAHPPLHVGQPLGLHDDLTIIRIERV
jgi:hypothetical protein